MKDINLTTISKDLLQTEQEMQKILPQMYKAEVAYNQKYYQLLLQSLGGSAPVREAEAKKALELEPIFDKYHELKLKIRLLYSKKETLTTISSNLRQLAWIT